MTTRRFDIPLLALLLLPVLAPSSPAFAGATATFRYPLSNFSGPVLSQWAQLAVDRERNEVYALDRRGNDIRIFDEHGMEIFVFGDGYASAADIAVGDDGDIFILTTGYQTATVHLLNYRGEHVSEIPLQNVPARFSELVADRLVYRDGSLYLVDSDALLAIVVDREGDFREGYDLNDTLRPFLDREKRKQKQIQDVDWAERQLGDISLTGFAVDGHGNMFFTVAVLFSAYRLSPDGQVVSFGRPGSGPGKFGVAAGIATDEAGYVYVADRLRSVVLVFDPSFAFQTEFGYRGDGPSNLIVPDDVAVDARGNLYVGQAANRGVSVFRVIHEAAVHEDAVREVVADEASFEEAEVQEAVAEEAEVQEAEAPEATVEEATRPSRGTDETSTSSERSDRIVEEDVSDQVDFIVDQGGAAPSAESGPSGWTIEEDESDHLEEN